MSESDVEQDGVTAVQEVGVRKLEPGSTRIFEGAFGLLNCTVREETWRDADLYRNVFAIRMFPVSHPSRFVSVRHTNEADKVAEIGVIDDLKVFPKEEQDLVDANLRKQYHEQTIHRVYSVRHEYGMLFFDVETQRGREQFIMPWKGDRTEDFGDDGKVLLDALDNRYVIPRVSELQGADQRRFTSYIYW